MMNLLENEKEMSQIYLFHSLKLCKEIFLHRFDWIDLPPYTSACRIKISEDMCSMLLPFIQGLMTEGLANKKDDWFANNCFNDCLAILQNCLSSRMIDLQAISQMGGTPMAEIMSSVWILIETIPDENIYVRIHNHK
jgi:hypothetical protein